MTYTSKDVVKDGASVTVGASQTNAVLTGNNNAAAFYIPACFATSWRCDVTCSAVTVTNAITLKLQTRFSNEQSWIDSKTASVTADGTFSINVLDTVAGDQSFLPLRPQARVVVTTGASDTVTVDAVYIPAIS